MRKPSAADRHKMAITSVSVLLKLERAVPQWKMDLTQHDPEMVLCTDGKEHPFCRLCKEQLDIPIERQFWAIKPQPTRLQD